MKEELLKIISDIVELLTLCGWQSKAKWFKEKAEKIHGMDIKSHELKNELVALNKILAGMGSFDDLPLYPSKESGLSEMQARLKQTELSGKLGEIIGILLENKNK